MKNIKKGCYFRKAGFTLIELLVVIAIIGILSSIILASLNTAREKGANATVKANLQGIRSQAEIVYDNTFDYTGVCTDTNIVAAVVAAMTAGADVTGLADYTTNGNISTRCNSSATEWAINVTLKAPENGGVDIYWCVDSDSKGTGEAAELGGATSCA